MTQEPDWDSPRHELYFAVIAPTGSNTGAFATALEAALRQKDYRLITIKLSSLLNDADDSGDWPRYEGSHEDERIDKFQNLGNLLCEKQDSGYAVARLGVAELVKLRRSENTDADNPKDQPLVSTAYLLSSLKRPEEVRMLRRLYGPWLFVFGIDTPQTLRHQRLSEIIAEDRPSWSADLVETTATRLIGTDRQQVDVKWGQNVLATYPEADFFVRVMNEPELHRSIKRYIDLLFGTLTVTPTLPEYAMSLAHNVSMRSGSQTRRVGAAVVKDGSVIALGVNQLPSVGGGHRFPGDDPDARDESGLAETTKRDIRSVIADLIRHFASAPELLSAEAKANAERDLDEFTSSLINNELKGASILDLIEFQRPVHAEMSAIIDAARRGISVQGASLYVTTYPCHLCAKEILYSGISEVIYIEPYPKSHAEAMYDEYISSESSTGNGQITFTPFVGVSPRRYSELFEHPIRADRASASRPYPLARYGSPLVGIIDRESYYLSEILDI